MRGGSGVGEGVRLSVGGSGAGVTVGVSVPPVRGVVPKLHLTVTSRATRPNVERARRTDGAHDWSSISLRPAAGQAEMAPARMSS